MGLFFTGMLMFNLRPSEAAMLKRSDLLLPEAGREGILRCYRRKIHQWEDISFEYGSVFHHWARECLQLADSEKRKPLAKAPLIICISGRCRRNPGGWMTDNLDKATERVCAQLGISLSRPYIIRHSIITWLSKQPGVPGAAISAHASHRKGTTKDIYTHLTAAAAKPAMEAIQHLMKSYVAKTG
jgi:integrase